MIFAGYAPFLSMTRRFPASNESSEIFPGPGQYDASPVKVTRARARARAQEEQQVFPFTCVFLSGEQPWRLQSPESRQAF